MADGGSKGPGVGSAGEFTRLRVSAGYSARQLAKTAGVSASCIVRAERGTGVTLDVQTRLARVLGSEVFAILPRWPPLPKGERPVIVARRRLELSRRRAALKLGVSDDVLARAERGLPVHPANAKRIADGYGLAVTDVLPWQDDNGEKAA